MRRSAPGMTDVVLDPLDDTRVHPFSYSDAIDLAAAVTGADRVPPPRVLSRFFLELSSRMVHWIA